ncbi:hypothetical protein MtrunA17_Chr2g0315821 [Medicago truncatula]|uniref:Uncharacterized protein n=1 Tax=Medicago truncatula TaxID=3880 RepID=A0A396J9J2_MEDTR|nr:hypothetical protein MtrunA17_Chr2g0315821 [Medicago truncatula]
MIDDKMHVFATKKIVQDERMYFCSKCNKHVSDESGSMPKEIITLVDSTLMFKGESNNNMDARLEKSYWVSKISNKVEKDRCQYDKKII